MPGNLELKLSEEKRAELEDLRDHARKPYLRERAAAILKIAAGLSGREVALHRLNRAHWPDTIYEWVRRYQEQGISGLYIKPGGGRKPAYFPDLSRTQGHPGSAASHSPSVA